MDGRIQPGSFFQYSPTGVNGSLQRSSSPTDRERYLSELLSERQKLAPFMQVMPVCSRLLNQEIMRASGLISNQSYMDRERLGLERPYRPLGQQPNGGPMDVETWSSMQSEKNGILRRMDPVQASAMGWPAAALGLTTTPVVKRVIRLDVPLDKFPNFNFVGRILGPRGNSLKRIEAMTECRIFIRGRGSVKDSMKVIPRIPLFQVLPDGGAHFLYDFLPREEKLKDKPGYEHLNEPLHLLIEAEFPEDTIGLRLEHAVALLENLLKPVDESMDVYKKQQLRELAMLNGTLREESPSMSPSMSPNMSPFNSAGMKRAKTGI